MSRIALVVGVACSLALAVPARADHPDDLPDVRSRAAVVLDAETGAELYGKDADAVRAIASTTKIFVAMAVRAKGLPLDGYTQITSVDAESAKGGARTRLDVGQEFTNRDLLRAMLIASDNRAPTALGRGAGMSADELVAEMNAVAKRLHLTRTKFTDPTGLHGNVSTAREMALALRAALSDDVLREIMADPSEVVESRGGHRKIHYGSTNLALVAHKWDVIGGKTGYTEAAGYCLVTAARFESHELLIAFYGGDGKGTRFADFDRVARWIDRGAPGAKVAMPAHDPRPKPVLDVIAAGTVAKD